jgi:hypothetical protein
VPISKNPASGRNYKKEAQFENTPERIKQREERNRARRQAEAAGKNVAGKDVAHIKPLAGGGSNTRTNERVESIAKNRSWRRGMTGYKVPVDK